jgi:hypothetical protein
MGCDQYINVIGNEGTGDITTSELVHFYDIDLCCIGCKSKKIGVPEKGSEGCVEG